MGAVIADGGSIICLLASPVGDTIDLVPTFIIGRRIRRDNAGPFFFGPKNWEEEAEAT